jgi:hypothetical protein
MDFLLREITVDQGQQVFQDTELVVDQVTIGSAPDQIIQLRGGNVQRMHAVIKLRADGLEVTGIANNRVIDRIR